MDERRPLILIVAAIELTARVLLAPQMTALSECGYDVRVACAPEGDAFDEALAPFTPIDVRFPRAVRPVPMARALLRFATLVRSLRPDVVHLHTPAAALTARLLPRVVVPLGTRVVYTVHGFAHVWDDLTVRNLALERVERLLAPRTDLLLFQSSEDLDQVRRRRYPVRTRFLGNGIQDSWFGAPARRGDPARPRALFVGRMVREKGILDLLDALAATPDLRLRVVGCRVPGERDMVADEVVRRAGAPPLAGRVDFLGSLDPADVRAEMDACDFLVLPSYREGVPRSIIEGMARGRPAVVANTRGSRELVRHGHTGLVCRRGDVDDLTRCLTEMASLGEGKYEAMSRAAFEHVSTHRRESAVIDRLVAAYSELGVPAGTPRRDGSAVRA